MALRNILLIDDDEEDQEIFLSAVKEISSSVKCGYFNDAKQALQKLSSGDIEPEIIFLDLNMPLMNGQQFLSNIKKNEKLSQIPVIIFTTSSNPLTRQLTKELGAHDFITKPGDFDLLVDLLKPYLS